MSSRISSTSIERSSVTTFWPFSDKAQRMPTSLMKPEAAIHSIQAWNEVRLMYVPGYT
ncbi:MAG: hypothetical protein U1F43_36580 [Myxococcota bacterium]